MNKVQEKLARKAAAKKDLGLEEPEVATEPDEPLKNQAGEEIGLNDEVPESSAGAQQAKPIEPPPLTANEEKAKESESEKPTGGE